MRNIILDLDSTLIYTHEEEETGIESKEMYSSFKLFSYNHDLRKHFYAFDCDTSFLFGVYRPHLVKNTTPKGEISFVDYCFSSFDNVVVWSAGYYDYVHCVCDTIFKTRKRKLSNIFSRDDCSIDKNGKLSKRLEIFFKDNEDGINETNTFIIDDNEETFRFNKKNAIHIPEFRPIFEEEYFRNEKVRDTSLKELIQFFEDEKFQECSDVRDLDTSSIFSGKY